MHLGAVRYYNAMATQPQSGKAPPMTQSTAARQAQLSRRMSAGGGLQASGFPSAKASQVKFQCHSSNSGVLPIRRGSPSFVMEAKSTDSRQSTTVDAQGYSLTQNIPTTTRATADVRRASFGNPVLSFPADARRTSVSSAAMKVSEDSAAGCKASPVDEKGCLRSSVQMTPPAKLNHFQCTVTPPPEVEQRHVPTPQVSCLSLSPACRAEDITKDISSSTRATPALSPRSECTSDWSSCSSPCNSPGGGAAKFKSEYQKEFADAQIPKKFFKALEKLSERGNYMPRQDYARKEFRKWKHSPGVVVENIWDDQTPLADKTPKADDTANRFSMPLMT